LADRLNQYNQFLHDPGYLPKDLERYNRATAADVKRVAEEKLKASARVVVYGLPGERAVDDPPHAKEAAKETKGAALAGTMPDEPWRANAPPAGPPSKLRLPVPVSFKLDNGLTVILAEQHQLPIVSSRLVVLNGSDANPVDKPGLASFTAQMLPEGTEHRSANQVADDAAQIGAAVHQTSISDYSVVSIHTLTPNADAAFDLLSDVTLHPKFDSAEIERERKNRETDILQIQDDPTQLCVGVLLKTIYGPDHPYGYREIGTTEANRTITRDDMVKMWQSGYAPGNSALVLTGDLTASDARAMAEKYFGAWKGTAAKHEPPPVNVKTSRGISIVDKPGAAQTFLLVGNLGVARSTPDYVPLEVMNNILGGLYSSRINSNLREEHGYTYGGFSAFFYRRGQGLFAAGGGIRTDATAPAITELFKELDRIRSTPPTVAELQLAKGSFAHSLAGLFESEDQTGYTLGDLFTYELPLDYYEQLPAKIDAVSADDVQRMAEKYIHPETSVVIGAGDRAKIEDELKKLSIGPVVVRDYEGTPVKEAAKAAGGGW
jgi:zinc protease